jgi:hypothetical protein
MPGLTSAPRRRRHSIQGANERRGMIEDFGTSQVDVDTLPFTRSPPFAQVNTLRIGSPV